MKYEVWEYEAKLPYYILDRYEIRKAIIDSVETVFLYPKIELEQMVSVKNKLPGYKS